MKRNFIIFSTLLALLLSVGTAQAATPVLSLHGHKITRLQSKLLHKGMIVKVNFYPSGDSPASPPPIPCAWYLDGLGMFWGGAHWTCKCLAPGVCQWNEDYMDPYGYPDGYVDTPPTGVCLIP